MSSKIKGASDLKTKTLLEYGKRGGDSFHVTVTYSQAPSHLLLGSLSFPIVVYLEKKPKSVI